LLSAPAVAAAAATDGSIFNTATADPLPTVVVMIFVVVTVAFVVVVVSSSNQSPSPTMTLCPARVVVFVAGRRSHCCPDVSSVTTASVSAARRPLLPPLV
jgi:hypothetical protein